MASHLHELLSANHQAYLKKQQDELNKKLSKEKEVTSNQKTQGYINKENTAVSTKVEQTIDTITSSTTTVSSVATEELLEQSKDLGIALYSFVTKGVSSMVKAISKSIAFCSKMIGKAIKPIDDFMDNKLFPWTDKFLSSDY